MTKILIVGDSGRGKTTLAQRLSEKLGIEKHSTDDYFWKVKFTLMEDKGIALEKIVQIYQKPHWIMEGSTRGFIEPGLETASLIIYLGHKNLLSQYWVLFKRFLTRDEEKLINLLRLYLHLFFKRYKLGGHRNRPTLLEMIKPYEQKVTKLFSFKDIDNFINQYNH